MKLFFQSLRIFLVLTVLTGVVYPVLVTAMVQICFPHQGNGSLVVKDGVVVGSELLAQKFQDQKYFWPRPSACDFSTVASGASNQGPTNAALRTAVQSRSVDFLRENGLAVDTKIPAEMVFASGSGLDPHISPEAVRLQIDRVAKSRGFDEAKKTALRQLIDRLTDRPDLHFLGKSRVNVFRLNLALDSL